MNGSSDGRTYSEVSGEYTRCRPTSRRPRPRATEELAGLRQTLFMGSTLRGLLLYGSAFATMGTIAGIAAIGSFVGAAVLLALFGFGLWHSRRVSVAEAAAGVSTPQAVPQPV